MKIYVDKMPKATGQGVENQEELEIRMIFDSNKTADIELIHDHDRELVEKVCDKIGKETENKCLYIWTPDKENEYTLFNIDKILNKIQKEFEENE